MPGRHASPDATVLAAASGRRRRTWRRHVGNASPESVASPRRPASVWSTSRARAAWTGVRRAARARCAPGSARSRWPRRRCPARRRRCAPRAFHAPASAPSWRGCRVGCWAGTTGCARGRRRGLPPRSRPAPRRSTGSRRGSSAAGSCPRPTDGNQRWVLQARRRRSARRASPARSGTDAAVEHDLAAGHVPDVSEANDVLDGRGSRSSSHAARVGVLAIVGVTSRSMRSITPAASSRRNRSSSDAAALAAAMVSAASPSADDRVGLDDGAVEHPRIPRADPDDAIRRHAVGEQPHDPVGGRLAGPDDHVAARRRRPVGRAR